MADQTERTYTIPLRKAFLRAPSYKRTKRSINEIRYFLQRHLKSDNIKIGKHLNQIIWSRGGKNPPSKIKVKVLKDKDNKVLVELPEFDFDIKTQDTKKKTKEEKTKEQQEATKVKEPQKEKSVDLSLEKNIKKAAKEQTKPKEETKA